MRREITISLMFLACSALLLAPRHHVPSSDEMRFMLKWYGIDVLDIQPGDWREHGKMLRYLGYEEPASAVCVR